MAAITCESCASYATYFVPYLDPTAQALGFYIRRRIWKPRIGGAASRLADTTSPELLHLVTALDTKQDPDN